MVNNTEEIKKLGSTHDITKATDKGSISCVKSVKSILNHAKIEKVIKLAYSTSNWAAVEGFMIKNIHRKFRSFGGKNLLSKKGLEIYDDL